MILCDTNILIEFYKGNSDVIQTLHQIGIDQMAVSVITKAELFYGARDKTELTKIERQLSLCRCYGLDDAVATLFLKLMRQYCLSHRATIPDMLIAATAMTYELDLYTLNTKDFKFIPMLNLYTHKS